MHVPEPAGGSSRRRRSWEMPLFHRVGLKSVRSLLLALAAASILGAWLLVSSTFGYSWDDDAWVPVDREGHVVSVEKDELAMVWRDETVIQPRCEVRDEAGEPLPLRPASGRYSRHAGSAGDWVGSWTFTPTATETVTVTCGRGTRGDQVPVTTAPNSATTPEDRLLRRGAAVLLTILAATSAAAAFGIRRRRFRDEA